MHTQDIQAKLLERYPQLTECKEEIALAIDLCCARAQQRKKMLVCGNGGSCADADHIVGELGKSFVLPRPINDDLTDKLTQIDLEKGSYMAKVLQEGVFAMNLNSHNALNSAFSNDVDASLVFAQQVLVYGDEEDILWCLTTSGNSKNVLNAAIVAKAKGMKIIGFTGESGGALKELCDVCICAPQTETYKVQELHLPIYHALCLAIEKTLWGKERK